MKQLVAEDDLAPVEPGKISPRDPGTGDIDILHMSEVQKREAKGRALRKVRINNQHSGHDRRSICPDPTKRMGGF